MARKASKPTIGPKVNLAAENAELQQALARAEARVKQLEGEVAEKSAAQSQAETALAEALEQQTATGGILRDDLAIAHGAGARRAGHCRQRLSALRVCDAGVFRFDGELIR